MALTAEQTVAIEDAQFNIDLAEQYIAQSQDIIATAQQNITSARENISFATSQLTSATLPEDRRQFYEANIAADLRVIESNELVIQNQQASINENITVISDNQNLITEVSSATTADPGSVNTDSDIVLSRQVSLQDSLAPGESVVNTTTNVADVNLGTATGDDLVAAYDAGPAEDPFEASRVAAEERYNNEAGPTEQDVLASVNAGTKLKAQQQKVLSARRNIGNNSDWRVKIKLAPNANYLYAAQNPGILAPLRKTGGVIFPYTPQIETQYTASYDKYDLIHSNYRGYFYKGSSVNEISLRGSFTAQDTSEAQYLLAVIHFFRSVTKMFYGKDPQAGTPPPLVYLSGFGPNQFNDHACVVSNFTYSLPTDVDYIRADAPNQIGVNLENRTGKTSGLGTTGPFMSVVNRLKNAKLFAGALPEIPDPNTVLQTVNTPTSTNATYVPTKMEINIQLLPVQTRSEVSQQFSLQGFANGQLLRGGFW